MILWFQLYVFVFIGVSVAVRQMYVGNLLEFNELINVFMFVCINTFPHSLCDWTCSESSDSSYKYTSNKQNNKVSAWKKSVVIMKCVNFYILGSRNLWMSRRVLGSTMWCVCPRFPRLPQLYAMSMWYPRNWLNDRLRNKLWM
jgi:hypothetical protein